MLRLLRNEERPSGSRVSTGRSPERAGRAEETSGGVEEKKLKITKVDETRRNCDLIFLFFE